MPCSMRGSLSSQLVLYFYIILCFVICFMSFLYLYVHFYVYLCVVICFMTFLFFVRFFMSILKLHPDGKGP